MEPLFIAFVAVIFASWVGIGVMANKISKEHDEIVAEVRRNLDNYRNQHPIG